MSGTEVQQTARQDFVSAQQRILDRYGVAAESRFVPTPILGGDAHVLVAGSGPPVMMVIGGGMVSALWAPLMAHLRGRTLYALELPGHGLTAPVHYDKETLRSTGVTFLTQVMEGLQVDRAPFVGQSVGGLWSTWMALDEPERVSAISYVSCPAMVLGASAPLPLRISTIRAVRSAINRLDPPSPQQVQRMGKMNGEDLGDLPEVRGLFLAYERVPGCLDTLLDLHRALVRLRGPRPEVELTADQLSRLRQPVQMIWGDRDPYGTPEVGQRMAAAIGHGSLHVFPGGHGPWFRQAEAIGPVMMEFLDALD